jgi:hypothetical protein
MLMRYAAHACLLLMLSACVVSDPLEEARLGCAGYAEGTCGALARCGDAFLAPYDGSKDACIGALSRACVHNLTQPDVYGTGAGAAACGNLIADIDCNALVNNELPGGCGSASGRRSDGARCSVSAQCASGRCLKSAPHEQWGACAERVPLGEACLAQEDCELGSLCSTQGRCVQLAHEGEACGDAAPCRAPLFCLQGLCMPPPAATAPVVPMVDPQQACMYFAHTLCMRLRNCSPRLVDAVYGEVQACTDRTTAACLFGITTPDAVSSGAGIRGCTDAITDLACSGLLENGMPDICQLAPGARVDGTPCGSDAQCMSTRCARAAASDDCGLCAALADAEQACVANTDCKRGLTCSADGRCRAPAPAGAACDAMHVCQYPLNCIQGRCAPGLMSGEACTATEDHCGVYAGLACAPSGKCEAWTNAAVGAACGYTDRGWAACTASASCSAAVSGGVCRAALPDGAACSAAGSDALPCLAPARCVRGTCTFAAATVCSPAR